MKRLLLIFLCFGLFIVYVYSAAALPAPCSEEKLIETADYAIEGFVTDLACGQIYDTKVCEVEEVYFPELVSDCKAKIKITKNIKGNYTEGDIVEIEYKKLVQKCRQKDYNYGQYNNLSLNSKIEYYNSTCQNNCRVLVGPIKNLSILR